MDAANPYEIVGVEDPRIARAEAERNDPCAEPPDGWEP